MNAQMLNIVFSPKLIIINFVLKMKKKKKSLNTELSPQYLIFGKYKCIKVYDRWEQGPRLQGFGKLGLTNRARKTGRSVSS